MPAWRSWDTNAGVNSCSFITIKKLAAFSPHPADSSRITSVSLILFILPQFFWKNVCSKKNWHIDVFFSSQWWVETLHSYYALNMRKCSQFKNRKHKERHLSYHTGWQDLFKVCYAESQKRDVIQPAHNVVGFTFGGLLVHHRGAKRGELKCLSSACPSVHACCENNL